MGLGLVMGLLVNDMAFLDALGLLAVVDIPWPWPPWGCDAFFPSFCNNFTLIPGLLWFFVGNKNREERDWNTLFRAILLDPTRVVLSSVPVLAMNVLAPAGDCVGLGLKSTVPAFGLFATWWKDGRRLGIVVLWSGSCVTTVLLVTSSTSWVKGDCDGDGCSLGLAGIDGDGLGAINEPGGDKIPTNKKISDRKMAILLWTRHSLSFLYFSSNNHWFLLWDCVTYVMQEGQRIFIWFIEREIFFFLKSNDSPSSSLLFTD